MGTEDETRAEAYRQQRDRRLAWRAKWLADHAGDPTAARVVQAGWQPIIDAAKEDTLDPEDSISDERRDERDAPLA